METVGVRPSRRGVTGACSNNRSISRARDFDRPPNRRSCKAYAMPSASSSRPNAAGGCSSNTSRQRARSRARGRPSRSWNSISSERIGTVHHSGDHARSIPHQTPVRTGCCLTRQQLQVARSTRVRFGAENSRQTLQALVPKCARKRFGRGWTSRSYSKDVSPDRSTLRTVFRDTLRSRAICLPSVPAPCFRPTSCSRPRSALA
jgi:hypothetical protein